MLNFLNLSVTGTFGFWDLGARNIDFLKLVAIEQMVAPQSSNYFL